MTDTAMQSLPGERAKDKRGKGNDRRGSGKGKRKKRKARRSKGGS